MLLDSLYLRLFVFSLRRMQLRLLACVACFLFIATHANAWRYSAQPRPDLDAKFMPQSLGWLGADVRVCLCVVCRVCARLCARLSIVFVIENRVCFRWRRVFDCTAICICG